MFRETSSNQHVRGRIGKFIISAIQQAPANSTLTTKPYTRIMNAMKTTTITMRRLINAANHRFSTTSAENPSLKQYRQNADGAKLVKDAVANPNDPRTFPRAAVIAGAGAFFGYMTYKTFLYKEHQIEERNQVIREEVPPRPSEVSKTVAENAPITMNAKRYETLRKEGLGVDHNEWKAKKREEVNKIESSRKADQ